MNWKTWVPLVLAIGLGLAAMKVARDVMSKNQIAAITDTGKQIIVLKKDLSPGTQIAAEDLGTVKMPGDLNAEQVFTQPTELEGRVLTTGGVRGAPVLQTMLAPKGTGSGLQSMIPDGMRAITIQIDEFSGVAGNLTPGSRVDILATIAGDNGEMISRTVVQNIRVQSLGLRRPPEASGTAPDPNAAIRSVTLLATPKEAEMIELAEQSRHRLVLRGSLDNDLPNSDGVSVAELRGRVVSGKDPFATDIEPVKPVIETPAAVPPSTPTTQPVLQASARRPIQHDRQIKVIRGGVESTTTVQEPPVRSGSRWMTGAEMNELPSEENN